MSATRMTILGLVRWMQPVERAVRTPSPRESGRCGQPDDQEQT
ncbi:hypothetical protein [Micromonospora halophytica]|nr:hypothetical protein [Micromonospora halophytica]